MSCINVNSPHFKELLRVLNIGTPRLKQVLHKLLRDYGHLNFSPEEIDLHLQGNSVEFGENSLELYEQRYKEPLIVSPEEYSNALNIANSVFPKEAVTSYQTTDGNYVIRVAEPINSVLKNTEKNKKPLNKKDVVKNRRTLTKHYKDNINVRQVETSIKENFDTLSKLFSNYTTSSVEEVTLKVKELETKFKDFIDKVTLKQLDNGNYTIDISFKDINSIINSYIGRIIASKSDAEVYNELFGIENGDILDTAFYLNKKATAEALEQINKKNNVLTEEEIKTAVDFLVNLENNPELNLYSKLCVKWLKDNLIILPRDHEVLLALFENARKYKDKIDIQRIKNPIDLQKAILDAAGENGEKKITPVNPTEIKEFTFNRVEEVNGKRIEIYDVENSFEGQTAVTQVLADSSPKDGNGRPIINSPWCLSTFNYNVQTKKATPTQSALNLWYHYNMGKRQIAFVDGVPVAFNSSSKAMDEWWNFFDDPVYSISDINTDTYSLFINGEYVREEYYEIDLNCSTYVLSEKSEEVLLIGSKFTLRDGVLEIVNDIPDLKKTGKWVPNTRGSIPTIDLLPKNSNDTIVSYNGAFISRRGMDFGTINGIKYIVKLPLSFIDAYDTLCDIVLNGSVTNPRLDEIQPLMDNLILELYKLSDTISIEKEKYRLKEDRHYKLIKELRLANLDLSKGERPDLRAAVVENNVLNNINNILTNIPNQQVNPEYVQRREEYETLSEETEVSPEVVEDAVELNKNVKLNELYNKAIKEPFNKELAKVLHDILKKYHFEIIEGDLKEIFGEDVVGATDFLQKVVYLANEGDRNALTDVEEFAHAFFKMMGTRYRRESTRKLYPENRLYSELRDLVETTSLYQETLELYRDTYVTRNHTTDLAKVKEEALGKALAAVIYNRYEAKTKEDKRFFSKLVRWFNSALQWFKGKFNKETELINELNKIADSILDGSYVTKYLKDSGIEGLQKLNFTETIQRQNARDGGKALSIIETLREKGLTLGGSMALRMLGTMYRRESDTLHDLDYSVNPEVHQINFDERVNPYFLTEEQTAELDSKVRNSPFMTDLLQSIPGSELISVYKVDENIITSIIISDNTEAKEKFKQTAGSYTERLNALSERERNSLYLLDVFINPYSKATIDIVEYGKALRADEVMKAKLKMGRAKDTFDYQHFNPTNRVYRNSNDVLFQKNQDNKAMQETTQTRNQNIDNKPKTIEYTPVGKEKQTYTIEGTRIVNKEGKEVFAEDSADRRKIFANLAVKEGRAVVVDYNNMKYVVNNLGKILSTATGNFVWTNTPENSNRKAILELARQKFNNKTQSDTQAQSNNSTEEMEVSGELRKENPREAERVDKSLKPNDNPENFNTKKESEKIVSSDRTILSNEELKYWNEQGVDDMPRILSASERTDPAFHVKEILDILDGRKTVPQWGVVDGQRRVIGNVSGKDFAGLYLITKHDGLPMKQLLETKIPKLIHFSITGLGGTAYEPGVMKYNDLLDRIEDYIKQGLDPNSVTIRIDPIVPGVTKAEDIESIVKRASEMGIKRIRFSIMDAYANTVEAIGKLGYDFEKYYGSRNGRTNFTAKPEYIKEIVDLMIQLKDKYGVTLGTCAENIARQGISKEGCLSVGMVNQMLGTSIEDKGTANNNQRALCSCYGGKIDALAYNKSCASHCVYCYAKHENDRALEYYNEDGTLKDNVYTRTRNETPTLIEQPSTLLSTEDTRINTEQESKQQDKPKEQDKMLEQIHIYNEQCSRILENRTLNSTDIAEVTNIIADMISSKINEMEAKRGEVKEILSKRNPKDNTDVDKLSRLELVKALGFQYFLYLVKQDLVKNRRTATPEYRAKITEVVKNWDFFVSRAKNIIYDIEGFHIGIDEIGDKTITNEKPLIDSYEEDGTNIQDQVEDGQLSWQVESNTVNPITNITRLVRLRLRGLYVLKDNGRRNENGDILYDRVKTKWGTDAKVGHEKAAKYLLRWLNDKTSLEDMAKELERKTKRNPWVTQLIPILTDKSGVYSTEQSQFFTKFYRPFRKFTNVGTKGRKLISRPLNEHPFLTLTLKTIEAAYKLGEHPLVSNGLNRGAMALNNHYTTLQELVKDFNNNKEAINYELRAITKGLGFEIDVTEIQLEKEEVEELIHELSIITRMLSKNANNPNYDPFAYGRNTDGRNTDGIRSNLKRFFEKLTDQYEAEAVTSFYEGGKMRQSYLAPSYLSMFVNKFKLDDAAFNRFLASEFNSEFFRDTLLDGLSDEELANEVKKGWKSVWIQYMMSDFKKRKKFTCKSSLTFKGKTYMKGMSAQEYALSMITEFFGEKSKDSDSLFLANFRIPIESNKPSAEYITFYARGGVGFKDALIEDFLKVFSQELRRMQTVILREEVRKKKIEELNKRRENGEITDRQYEILVYNINQEAITNFDTRGSQFVFLDFLNKELPNKNSKGTTLGKLIDATIHGKKVDEALLTKEAAIAIEANIQDRVNSMIDGFISNGVFEKCKTIENIGTSDEAVRRKLELMLWNDAFAYTQIMQLFVTDPAFLKNTDDIQKRMAQLHSSGDRPNITARTFPDENGNSVEVSDGVHRSITLKDVSGFVSNIIENLTIVFDNKIKNAKDNAQRIAWETLKENLIGENGLYRKGINLTDAQAYSCPTSYRKKALMFGQWSKEAEEAYKRIKDGNYTYSDVMMAFQPFKPFLYGNSIEDTGVNGPMTKMRVSVQNKNAECLLVMADAILANEDTGKPNLLRALFEVMEESHFTTEERDGKTVKVYKTDGIDTVNFESAVKSGGQGRIDTQAYADGKEVTVDDGAGNEYTVTINHENAFKNQLKSLIYKTEVVDGKEVRTYKRGTVKHISYENYCMQQSVPEHFLDHSQLEGSQQRAFMTSDLTKTTIDENGQEQTVYYEVGKDKVKMTADQVRERYDELHAELIQKGIDEISELFMLKNSTPQQRKEALSKILFDEFSQDERYSGDMLYMVTLNKETGDFPISLEDPSIRTQVEQSINSIIKSRVNKLKMKGGPLVQVSNFGMSKELKIKFLDKEGNPLLDRSNFNSDEEYRDYITKNQAGMSHMEVIAPAYTEGIFKKFMDKEGNISVEALELLDPDLLKMVGYRIPTEAKYSIAPLKIVGFAPKEMGDVIILPAEITLITGSDFDVDKEYCLRKTLDVVYKVYAKDSKGKFSEIEVANIVSRKLATELITEGSERDKKSIRIFTDRFVNDPYNKKLWMNEGLSEEEYRNVLKKYVNTIFEVKDPSGTDLKKNEIFDISYAVLTSESNVAKALKPGGFEDLKQMGYAVTAYRNPTIRKKYSFDDLLNMDIKELGKLIESDNKNLMFLDTQLEYYDHNNSASSLLGISAVNGVAHSFLVDDNIGISLEEINIPTIAGFQIGSFTVNGGLLIRLDPSIAEDASSIAETLGSCVGASADAAKDPVLDVMNLNPQTFNVFTTLIRIGVPKETAILLMSSKVMSNAIRQSNAETLEGEWSTPESVLREMISSDNLEELGYSESNPQIFTEELTREELIEGVASNSTNIDLKIANVLVSLYELSRRVRLADKITRFNSTSSAVGPTTLDNYIFQSNLDTLDEESMLFDMTTGMPIGRKELLGKHKMLAKFSEAYDLANTILIENMPQTKAFIGSIEKIYATPDKVNGLDRNTGLTSIVRNDRSLMGKLRDFFTSWIALKTGLVSYRELNYLSTKFPKTVTKKRAEHSDNYLVQNLYLNIDNRTGFSTIVMNISKIEKSSRDTITTAWADLYAKDKEFALNLFKYSFFRGGLGFSPKTFMNVLPVQMKTDLDSYLRIFRNPQTLSIQESNLLYKQFVSNNAMNNKLVPIKKASPGQDGMIRISKKDTKSSTFKNVKYFKTETKTETDNDAAIYKLYECIGGYEEGPLYRVYKEIPMLGAEGNFLELSTEDIENSAFDVLFDLEDSGNMVLTPDVNDIPIDRLKTVAEAQKALNEVLTLNQQQEIIETMTNLEGLAERNFIQETSARLSTLLKNRGLTPMKEDVLIEAIKKLNLCK